VIEVFLGNVISALSIIERNNQLAETAQKVNGRHLPRDSIKDHKSSEWIVSMDYYFQFSSFFSRDY
jgi:hypothetical protein